MPKSIFFVTGIFFYFFSVHSNLAKKVVWGSFGISQSLTAGIFWKLYSKTDGRKIQSAVLKPFKSNIFVITWIRLLISPTLILKSTRLSSNKVEEIKNKRERSKLYFVLLGAVRAHGHEGQKRSLLHVYSKSDPWIRAGLFLFFLYTQIAWKMWRRHVCWIEKLWPQEIWKLSFMVGSSRIENRNVLKSKLFFEKSKKWKYHQNHYNSSKSLQIDGIDGIFK